MSAGTKFERTCTYCGGEVPSTREDWSCSSTCKALVQSPRPPAPVKRTECKRCGGPVGEGFASFCSTDCMFLGAR